MIKKLILAMLASLALAQGAQAAGGGAPWDKFPDERVTDLSALQNGAKLFVNYCLNCHSASYMRYNRLRDIGLTEEQIAGNLVFTGAKIGETMNIAASARESKDWFGATPPDLTLVARSRSAAGKGSGADYIYTFLRSYYRDEGKATGWDNTAFPSVAMPHVLWELQGQQRAVYAEVKDAHDPSKVSQVFKEFEPITPGTMSREQYNLAVADLVAFLKWMAEPNQTDRVRIGVWVLLFLSVMLVFFWRLNAAYWKDIK